jgi:hypothetical protein
MADRRVHASEETLEVVRYERSGKWRVECARDSRPEEIRSNIEGPKGWIVPPRASIIRGEA